MDNTQKLESLEFITYEGYKYFFEHKLAKHKIDMCLATKNPHEYCNGVYMYSDKDPGDGMAFVIVTTDNPNFRKNDTVSEQQSKKQKSYLELKIVSNNMTELNLLINHYEKLGFISEGFLQDNGEVYWTFLKINNGLVE